MTTARRVRFWLVVLATVLALAATLWLGAWQLGRAAQKEALHASMEERKTLPALDNIGLAATKNVADVVHRPVLLRGQWMPEHTVFLDNRQMQGKPGFDVLTPLRLDGGQTVVVVQRGWVQRNFTERERLPAIDTPAGLVEVAGRIAPPPPKLYEFKGAPAGAIRQNLDLGEFSAQTRLPLRRDLTVQQTGAASGGLLREWTQARSGVDTHYGYAFQWFALAALIASLYAWFQFIAPAVPAAPDQPLGLTVHSMPSPADPAGGAAQRTVRGRWQMLAVLAVCAAPVIASYFTYYVIRPEGRRNYGELVDPQRPLPEATATAPDGTPVPLRSLKGQWLLVSVAGGACDAGCERHLYLQRQLRESLGKEKARLDRVWLVADGAALRTELLPALKDATVLRVDPAQLSQWLAPAQGRQLADHLYVVDPLGNWMMRFPAGMDKGEAPRAKRDLERLLRASGSWDEPGRK